MRDKFDSRTYFDSSTETLEAGDDVMNVPLRKISPNPFQPLKHFDEKSINELSQSIRDGGVHRPILLRPSSDNRSETIAGLFKEQASSLNYSVAKRFSKIVDRVAKPEKSNKRKYNRIIECMGEGIAEHINRVEKKSRKKKKAESVYLTFRDIDIFRILSSGPAGIKYIQQKLRFFGSKKLDKESETPDKPENAEKKLSLERHALLKRLSILKTFRYIDSRRYADRAGRGGVYSLYTLTQYSKEVLANYCKYPSESIRMGLPGKYGVVHELIVTDVVRTIKREAGKLKYEYSFKDKNTLRRESTKKGDRFPALLVNLYISDKRGKNVIKKFAVDIDNSTRQPIDVYEKSKTIFHQYGVSTMILCNDRARIDKLIATFKPLADATMAEMIYLSLSQEFAYKGFAKTCWVMPDRDIAEVFK